MTETIETIHATLSRTGPHEIEIRFAPGTLDKQGIAEVIVARKQLAGDAPVGLLLIIPPDTELDVAMIATDHQKIHAAEEQILGLAAVAGSGIAETLLRLYKAYYPKPFRAEVFTDEGEARTWLRACIGKALEAPR